MLSKKRKESETKQTSKEIAGCTDVLSNQLLSARELFKIFSGPDNEIPVDLPPSLYIIEFKRSHEERQTLLKRHQVVEKNKEFKGELEIIPNVILFQKWNAVGSYTIKFTISNRLKNPLDVDVNCKPSPYFSIMSQTVPRHCKLANGIVTPFTVVFTPNALRDYEHRIVVTTSYSKIIIRIIAVGPRPILDFPDKVDFGETPVKVFISRVLMVGNVGEALAVASLTTDSPFDVSPKCIYLMPNESTAVNVSFCSRDPGLFLGSLKVYHDNGDEMVVKLVGIAGNFEVRLEKDMLELADTFMGTRTEGNVKIYNDSDHVLSFKWLKNPSPVDDMDVILNTQRTDASIQVGQVGSNVDFYTSGHNPKMIMDRVHLDGCRQLQQGDLVFKHNNFEILPLVGEVNPHSEKTVTVIFEPIKAVKYSTKAYCEIEGAHRRFPLELIGTGIGPDIKVNVDVIDFDLIFLKLEHTYELLFSNLGLIKGVVKFQEPHLLYGGILTAYPNELVLKPAESQFLCIKFMSSTIGSFVEEVFFDVLGSAKALRVIIKGKVVSPLVTFDRASIDFGTIAFGFPISQTLRIENKSPIPATFRAVVPDDGDSPSLPVWKFGDRLSLKGSIKPPSLKVADGKLPQEFSIVPSSGVLIPYGSINLEITLTPNIAREHHTTLQIWLRDVEYEELSIPIHFIACQARLTASPSVIVHRYAFIGCLYSFDITLENEGETPLFFFAIPKSESDESSTGIHYSLDEDYGIINGNSTTRLVLNVMVSKLGKAEDIVLLNIFGQPLPLKLCTVVCYGIGPAVTAEPYSLSWKDQPIGIPSTKELTLRNICPIPAEWSLIIELDYYGGYCDPKPWTLSCEEGILQPYDKITIEVTAFLIDSTRIVALLILDVTNSTSTSIKLVANGTGTSILFEPPLMESWDFGDIFINEEFTFPIIVKNIGTLHHRLIFTQKKLKSSDMASNKTKRLPLQFSPDRIDLEGCENRDMNITIYNDVVGQFACDVYLYATINRKGRRILIGQSTLKANFIFPLLVVEPRVLNMYFRLENLTMELPTYITADVAVWTTTQMPVETQASVKQPFALVSKSKDLLSQLFFHATKLPFRTTVHLDLYNMNEEQMKSTAGFLTFTVMEKYKTRVPIKAAVLFPYLTTNESEVHLGSCEPYVSLYSILLMKNKGNVLVNFRWKLVIDSFKYIDVICPEISHILETEEMKRAMTKLDVLPKWELERDGVETEEDAVPVDRSRVASRSGVLGTLAQGVPSTPKVSNENDISKINAHAIVVALVPILNKTLLPALITAEKDNLPALPRHDDRIWDLDLAPSYGTLPSQFETITHALVEPDRLGVFVGDAVCEVENGLSETITFKGACGPPYYRLEPEIIDFGIRKFCELWTTTFKIINIGWTSFFYEINIRAKDHLFEYSMLPRNFAINPASKLVESGGEVVVEVIFYPAVTGPIKKSFLLFIGSAPPVEIEIKGFASCPQILINCPMDKYFDVPEEINYSAIGRQLCNEWFCPLFTSDIELTDPVLKTLGDMEDQHVCLEVSGPAAYLQNFLHPFEVGWVIVTKKHFVPSPLDITSAVERELCHDYFHYLRPKMLRHTFRHFAGEIKKEKSFPYFTLPGYRLDFGPIIIGSEKHYDLEIKNPGPLDVDFRIRMPFKNKIYLAKKGITFEEKDSAHLLAGESLTMKFHICPSTKLYQNLNADCSIEFSFHIEVACGGRIPIHFSTTITYPYLTMKKKIVFGQLKCGQKKLVYFIIKNSGLVPVSWQCHQRDVRKRQINNLPQIDLSESPFSFSPLQGFLEPQSYQIITVEFLPTMEGKFEKVLEFNIIDREQPQLVRLVGSAVEPKVDIAFQDMDFVSIVPFSTVVSKELTATNNTDFPLEVFFPEFDYDICEEEKIFSALCQYYQVPNMFVPSWCYDTSMTADLKNIYYQKLGMLAEGFYRNLNEIKSRSRELNRSKHSASRSSEQMGSRPTDDSSPKTKKTKSKKKQRVSIPRDSKSDVVKNEEPAKDVEVRTAQPSLDEKISLYLNYLQSNPEVSRPDLFQPIHETSPAEDENLTHKLIFFGGGPNTNYKYWAKYMARQTKLLYVSIDELILYAASMSQHGPAAAVRKAINDVYCRVVMGLEPAEHSLLDQFDPLSEVGDALLDLLVKMTAIERRIEEYREDAQRYFHLLQCKQTLNV